MHVPQFSAALINFSHTGGKGSEGGREGRGRVEVFGERVGGGGGGACVCVCVCMHGMYMSVCVHVQSADKSHSMFVDES